MTKKSSVPHESVLNTLPNPKKVRRDAHIEHAQPVREASDSDVRVSEDKASAELPYGLVPGSLMNLFLHLQSEDDWCRRKAWERHPQGKVCEAPYKGTWRVDHAGLVRCDGAVYVPRDPATKAEILRANHDDPWQGGHFGRSRTLEIIQRFYWWPGLAKDVREYCASCDVCQRMKVPRHRPYGKLAPLPQPRGPWEDISLDFIVGLPPSLSGRVACDAILVVCCRYSKMTCFIPCTGTVDAEELSVLLLNNVFSKWGIPRSIVSDRGSTFTSEYWSTLCYYLAIKRCISTAFHPQTDGQTERMNQTLECYLRCYIGYEQDDWTTLLASAEYASNNAVNATTGQTPFSMVLTFAPSMRVNLEQEELASESRAGKDRVAALEATAKRTKAAWQAALEATEKYYNKKRKDVTFQEGQLVLLASKHIRTRRASKKLADKYLGPFKVLKRVGQNAYRLELPQKYGRLHPTFHVSLLEAYRTREGVEPPEPVEIDGEEEFVVERVLDERTTKSGRVQYLVRWQGYSEADDTWEPAEHMVHAGEAIAKFTRNKQEKSIK